MTLSKLHARIQEDKKKLNPIDGRRFNSRSREKIRVLKKSAKKLIRKSHAKKHLHKGLFSKEEVAFSNEMNQQFRDECSARMEMKLKMETKSAADLCSTT